MDIRPTNVSDIPQILELYEDTMNFKMDREFYDYLYLDNERYSSYVVSDSGKIVAHNAFIPRDYLFSGEQIKVLLSSGGMVDSNYSGIFLSLMRRLFKNAEGDAIIAFPNKNSEPFFTRIFKFDVIQENYFTLKANDFIRYTSDSGENQLKMTDESFSLRLKQHPRNSYTVKEINGSTFVYKIYDASVDIIYVDNIGEAFVEFIDFMMAMEFSKFNIVHADKAGLMEMGFQSDLNNVFVYKWINKKYEGQKFACQMIDSDVF